MRANVTIRRLSVVLLAGWLLLMRAQNPSAQTEEPSFLLHDGAGNESIVVTLAFTYQDSGQSVKESHGIRVRQDNAVATVFWKDVLAAGFSDEPDLIVQTDCGGSERHFSKSQAAQWTEARQGACHSEIDHHVFASFVMVTGAFWKTEIVPAQAITMVDRLGRETSFDQLAGDLYPLVHFSGTRQCGLKFSFQTGWTAEQRDSDSACVVRVDRTNKGAGILQSDSQIEIRREVGGFDTVARRNGFSLVDGEWLQSSQPNASRAEASVGALRVLFRDASGSCEQGANNCSPMIAIVRDEQGSAWSVRSDGRRTMQVVLETLEFISP